MRKSRIASRLALFAAAAVVAAACSSGGASPSAQQRGQPGWRRRRRSRSASSPTSARSTTRTSTSTPGSAPRTARRASARPPRSPRSARPRPTSPRTSRRSSTRSYDIIVTVGFAAGARHVDGRQGQPGHQVHRRRPGSVHHRGRRHRIRTFACAGDAATLLPNLLGIGWKEQQPGYLAGIVAASISKTRQHRRPSAAPAVGARRAELHPWLRERRQVGQPGHQGRGRSTSSAAPDKAAFNDPAGGQGFAQQMLSTRSRTSTSSSRSPAQTGNGVLQAACEAEHLGHRRRRRPVRLDARRRRSASCRQRREEAQEERLRRDRQHRGRHRQGRRRQARPHDRRRRPVAVPRLREPDHGRHPGDDRRRPSRP